MASRVERSSEAQRHYILILFVRRNDKSVEDRQLFFVTLDPCSIVSRIILFLVLGDEMMSR